MDRIRRPAYGCHRDVDKICNFRIDQIIEDQLCTLKTRLAPVSILGYAGTLHTIIDGDDLEGWFEHTGDGVTGRPTRFKPMQTDQP